jgi:DNA-binding MarR family transcriptional regulator
MTLSLRPAQALKLWHESVLDLVHLDETGLTVRQLSILLTVYLDLPPHTVRGMAQKLKVTKPVITRALDSLGRLDLVARRRDPADKRNVLIQRTVKGALFVEKLGDIMVARAQTVPS